MASTRTYAWKDGDQRWFLAARYFAESGYPTVSAFAEAIFVANPHVDWAARDTAAGTVITIPYLDV